MPAQQNPSWTPELLVLFVEPWAEFSPCWCLFVWPSELVRSSLTWRLRIDLHLLLLLNIYHSLICWFCTNLNQLQNILLFESTAHSKDDLDDSLQLMMHKATLSEAHREKKEQRRKVQEVGFSCSCCWLVFLQFKYRRRVLPVLSQVELLKTDAVEVGEVTNRASREEIGGVLAIPTRDLVTTGISARDPILTQNPRSLPPTLPWTRFEPFHFYPVN